MKRIHGLLVLLVSLTVSAWAAEPEMLAPYELVSKKRVGRTVMEYTFQARLRGGDRPLHNVRATAVSNSPATEVIDGEVTFGDVDAGATVLSRDTFTVRQDRRQGNFSPDSLKWQVQYDSPLTFEVTGGFSVSEKLRMRVGKADTLFIDTGLKSVDGRPFKVRLSQHVTPDGGVEQDGYLKVDRDYYSVPLHGFELNSSLKGYLGRNIEQDFRGLAPGRYTVTTTAMVVETGQRFSRTTQVKVYGEDEPFLSIGLDLTNKIEVGAPEEQPAEVSIHGPEEELKSIRSVWIKRLDTWETFPLTRVKKKYTVVRPRLYGYDYKGSVRLDTKRGDHCAQFIVEVDTPKGLARSEEPEKVCVTKFPLGYQHPRPENLVKHIVLNMFYPTNMLILVVKEGTSEARIEEIAQAVDGKVIGQSKFWPYYQIYLSNPPSLWEGFNGVAEILKSFPEVLQVQRYAKFRVGNAQPSSQPPYDIKVQPHMSRIQADQAWYVTGGLPATAVAIVDTGIDPMNPALGSQIVGGENYLPWWLYGDNLSDVHGHGSHVAGIAAANDSLGLAGVSPRSSLLSVRVADASREAFYQDIADGIAWAAEEGKAVVINASIGVPQQVSLLDIVACRIKYAYKDEPCDIKQAIDSLCSAVRKAVQRGSLVVAAAGNAGREERNYPAACEGAIAVGAVDALDQRAHFSNYGEWVDLAAPGVSIVSTVPLKDLLLSRQCSIVIDGKPSIAYDCKSGTSQAAPQVSGALALVLAQHPEWIDKEHPEWIQKAVTRLRDTARPLPGEGLGKGLLDAFEAVFNGDFEVVEQHRPWLAAEWEWDGVTAQNCWRAETLYGIAPASGRAMLACTTAGSAVAAGMWNRLEIPAGVTELPVTFDWKLVTEEFTSYRGTGYTAYNDGLIAELVKVDEEGRVVGHGSVRFERHINQVMLGEEWDPGDDELFPTRHASFRQSNWHTDTVVFPVEYGAGRYYLRFYVEDVWDANGVTYALIDRVRLRAM